MEFTWVRAFQRCVLAVAVTGCTGNGLRETTALSLVQAGNADVVRAQNEFDGAGLIVRGTVASKGLVPRTNVSETGWGWTAPPGPMYMRTAQEVDQEAISVVALEPGGQVLCYFEHDRLEQVANLVVGRPVVLECTFHQYRSRPSGNVAVLTSCEVSDRARAE